MGILESIATVIVEIWENKMRMFRLAKYELKNQHGGTFFGVLWNFLNPLLQVFVYWFVFAIGLRRGGDIDGVPYVVWLVTGIICWTYMNQAMFSADTSIISFVDVLKRMRFPMAVVPAKTITSNLILHLCSMIIVFATALLKGAEISSSIWLLPYYMFAATFFIFGYALISSAVNVLFRDFHSLSSVFFRFMFFVSPVMWLPDKDNEIINIIMKLNPFAYILDGYRDTLFYGWSLAESLETGLIFWTISIIMFIAGCVLHTRVRHKFIDML